MKIDEALRGVSRLAFDTAPIIYFVEANPAYDKLVSNIFKRVADGELDGWTSVVSLSEVLVQPILSGRADLQRAYRELLLKSANFQTGPINAMVAESAALIRRVMAFACRMLFKLPLPLIPGVRLLFAMTCQCSGSQNCGS